MYESPIELIYQGIQSQMEDCIYKTIQKVDIKVDKEELLKALAYDREQYKKGYEDAKAEMKSGQWIPCSERLPHSKYGESDSVLTTCCLWDNEDYRFVRKLYYNGGGIWCYPTGETYEKKVLAWMPFPEPYKEEDNE